VPTRILSALSRPEQLRGLSDGLGAGVVRAGLVRPVPIWSVRTVGESNVVFELPGRVIVGSGTFLSHHYSFFNMHTNLLWVEYQRCFYTVFTWKMKTQRLGFAPILLSSDIGLR
jgi:hypothetical protein